VTFQYDDALIHSLNQYPSSRCRTIVQQCGRLIIIEPCRQHPCATSAETGVRYHRNAQPVEQIALEYATIRTQQTTTELSSGPHALDLVICQSPNEKALTRFSPIHHVSIELSRVIPESQPAECQLRVVRLRTR